MSISEGKISEGKIVDFTDERTRRIMVEATRLAGLSPGEWRLWIDGSAERVGVERNTLEAAVIDIIKNRERKTRDDAAEERRIEQRAEKQRTVQALEQRQIEKDAERKVKEKTKAFAAIIKFPSDQHDAKLTELAKRLDEDLTALHEEFAEFVGVESSATPASEWHVEPWDEPVATAALLQELIDKIGKHVVARPHELLTIALWVAMSWAHDVAAAHSTYLTATSAEPDSGKTTLLGVIGYLVPKPFTAVESTGPSIFRFVDREKPTLLVDEADDLFQRKADVKHIFNAGWTRGAKIARQVTIQGVSTTVWFNIFCPKAVGLLGMNMPRTLIGRSIAIKLWPKRPDEKQSFDHEDDDEFAHLRRKLTRWSADNAVALKDAKPLLPANFNNRLAANWRLLLGIAELAGDDWPKQVRDAAERLSRAIRKPSWGLRILAALRTMFTGTRKQVTSKEVAAELNADPDGVWCEYNHGGPITQRQVADILEQYDIHPVVIHPTKRSTSSPRGYKVEQFHDVFERLLPVDPHIRTRVRSGRKSRRRAR
jgi:putative DNA primase/helicase